MYLTAINDKRGHKFDKSKKEYVGEYEGWKGEVM